MFPTPPCLPDAEGKPSDIWMHQPDDSAVLLMPFSGFHVRSKNASEDICIDDLPAALLERLSQKEERRRKALAGFSPRLHPRRGRRGGERGREGEDTAAQVRHRRHEVCLVLSPPKSDLTSGDELEQPGAASS